MAYPFPGMNPYLEYPKIPNIAVATPAVQPKTVAVPITEIVKQRYRDLRFLPINWEY
ncbi:hypothetical protein [Nostoc sp. CALU 546]|uniref:hypothetical protein n=1 Tax=Nostoc sp. CALU 546 TaxID=1867241 RepID=UPI003B671AC6